MYERMLTKQHLPNETDIKEYLGAAAWVRMMKLEAFLANDYDFKKRDAFSLWQSLWMGDEIQS